MFFEWRRGGTGVVRECVGRVFRSMLPLCGHVGEDCGCGLRGGVRVGPWWGGSAWGCGLGLGVWAKIGGVGQDRGCAGRAAPRERLGGVA